MNFSRVGQAGDIIVGDFCGWEACVEQDLGPRVSLRLHVGKAEKQLQISEFDFVLRQHSLQAALWAKICEDFPKRGYQLKKRLWWAKASVGQQETGLLHLLHQFSEFSADVSKQMLLDLQTWQVQFEQEFGALSREDCLQHWQATKEQWLSTKAHDHAVILEHFDTLFASNQHKQWVSERQKTIRQQDPTLNDRESYLLAATDIAERFCLRGDVLRQEAELTYCKQLQTQSALEQANPNNSLCDPEQEQRSRTSLSHAGVYADWLQLQQDPRGLLMAIQLRLEQQPSYSMMLAEQDYLAKHDANLLGKLRHFSSCFEGQWQRGFLNQVHIRFPESLLSFGLTPTWLLRELCLHPSARWLQTLFLEIAGDQSTELLPELMEILGEMAPESLTQLSLGFPWLPEATCSTVHVGRLEQLGKVIERLTSLTIHARHWELGYHSWPNLHTLALASYRFSLENWSDLQACTWPSLTELCLQADQLDPLLMMAENTSPCWVQLLDKQRWPKLKKLGIHQQMANDSLCFWLPHIGIANQIHELDLSNGQITDEGARHLWLHTSSFEQLELLDLRGNYLSKASVIRLQTVCKHVRVQQQKPPVIV
jgi:hypothetical protein